MNIKALLGTGILAGALAIGSIASSAAQTIPSAPNTGAHTMYQRGERGSAANLLRERRRLEVVIDRLSHDQHDYGGHRVAAISLLQQARAQLDQAIEYDRTHPNH
ncbi:MAG TPA: hypothetical protein VIG32_08095 [Candidatus Baltobacteraceae bacterium]|jgi:hypothetical protein